CLLLSSFLLVHSYVLGQGVPTTGLVSYWKLDDVSDGSGPVTRLDSVGSNHLTDNNTVASAPGKIGNGADFESANNEFFSITDASQNGLDITGDLTISCWVKFESVVGIQAMTGKHDPTGNNRSYILYW